MARRILIELARVANLAPSDSRARMDLLAKIRKALGLDDSADEAKVIEVLEAKLGSDPLEAVRGKLKLADDADAEAVVMAIEALDSAEKSLEDRAKAEGKTVISSGELTELNRKADAGEQASKDLAASKFTTAFEKTISEGRAAPVQREHYEAFYEASPEKCLEALSKAPKIVNTESTGSGKDKIVAPDGVAEDSYELDRKVQAYMTEHNVSDYAGALNKVMAEDRKAAA